MILLDVEIPFVGKNKKYTRNKYTGQSILTQEYRNFKQSLYTLTKKAKGSHPFIIIELFCYHDIDAIIQPVLDSIQKRIKQNDRDIRLLLVVKHPEPKGGKNKLVIHALDDILCGLGGSQLILLGARPGGGKTSLALNISTNISKHKPVLFYSFEMSSTDLTCRILSSMASVEFWKIKFNKMSQFEKERIDNALQRFKKLNLYFAGRMNLTQIINSIKSFHTKQEIGLAVIDYLQLVSTSQAEQRYIEVGNISRELKNIAVDLNIPVFALSQLNRNMDYRQDKHPVLADLRESGSLEQDSDVVLFLHHDEKEKNTSLIIAKNRNGATGRETLFFDKKFTKFIDTGCLFNQVKEVEDEQRKLLEVKW